MEGQKLERGMIHIYTGNGKGKTTASIGLAFRATGQGFKVYMIQFMKGGIDYGELLHVENCPNFEIKQFGRPGFVNKENPEKIDIDFARQALEYADKIIKSGEYDVVILDEINVALEWKLIDIDDVISLIKEKPGEVELVLTGRYAPEKIIEIGDYVTEMVEVKHPYSKDISARKGIEY